MDKLLREIEKHEVVTFDVFDTLLKRPFRNADDLFLAIAEQFPDIKDFVKQRKHAETAARKVCTHREVNLDEIYSVLERVYGKETCKKLKEIEIQTEIDTAILNLDIYPYYQKCLSSGKTIYIISDMYLPGTIISRILSKIGICGYNKLYSSCDYRKTKWENGDLFKYVIQENQLNPSNMLHIGDNKRADIDMAAKCGISTYQVLPDKGNSKRKYSFNGFISEDRKKIYSYRLKRFTEMTVPRNKSIAFSDGYRLFGPILYFYVKSLKDFVEAESIDKVLFFSRDGYILQKAYKLIDEKMESQYFYISRKSVIIPLLYYTDSFKEFLGLYKSWPKNVKIKQILSRMGLEPELVCGDLKKYNLSQDDEIPFNELVMNQALKKFYVDIHAKTLQNAKSQKDLFLTYFLRSVNKVNRFAIVDIGARCTIEKALKDLLGKNKIKSAFYTYYFRLENPNEQTKLRRTCYINTSMMNAVLRFCYMFLEVFLSAPHGTVLGYQKNENSDITPKLDDFIYPKMHLENDCQAILDLQNGALEFVRNYAGKYEKYLPLDQDIVFSSFFNFGLFPEKQDLLFWGKIHFDADDFESLISAHTFKDYVKHPSLFMKDFSKSMWPAGFVCDVFRSRTLFKILFWFYLKLKTK